MKKLLPAILLLPGALFFAQTNDSIKSKELEAVTIIAKKPTVENKSDRTVFNVANTSILAGNTSWDIVRMTPLVSVDNNDNLKAEGESVIVYINDRKSVFTGKQLKDYLGTIPADNLVKIEVITSPSSRYDATGTVINIVLKKREDEGLMGSVSLTNKQQTKNNQNSSLNLNYHKKNFTQTFTGSYQDNTYVTSVNKNYNYYNNNSQQLIDYKITKKNKNISFSSTSEFELNPKNNIGLVLEYFNSKDGTKTDTQSTFYENGLFRNHEFQLLDTPYKNNTIGTNLFYKYYDKEKNRILDINLGINLDFEDESKNQLVRDNLLTALRHTITGDNTKERNYYIKVDYSTPLGENGGSIELGAKANFNNNVIANSFSDLMDITKNLTSDFHYTDNINSLYFNYSKTFFDKLETRIGLRYEHIQYKIRENVNQQKRNDSYGTFLPNLLVKYSFSRDYDLSLTYNHKLWRPWYSEFNPFELPSNSGVYSRGNMELLPNPSDAIALKFGVYKKYFLSARYTFTDQDYFDTYIQEGDKTVQYPDNFKGKVKKLSLNLNTNQNLFNNKLNVNFGIGWNYTDNSDFNSKNGLSKESNYLSNFSGTANLSYTNLFNKNINLSGWLGVYNQNYGNTVANQYNYFHTISVTKIFPTSQIETSLQFMNIFKSPNMNTTTYSQIGTFQSNNKFDWYGVSLTFVKRFGNQKVKQNTKTDVEKNEGGAKS